MTAPPLLHRVQVVTLDPEGENRFRLRPDAAERERIARFLDIPAVERMAMTGRILRLGDGWQVRGQLTATVVQDCVVTLEPVRGTVDVPVRRSYQPGVEAPRAEDLELHEQDLDAPDPLGSAIDLGELAVETLTLNLDRYPRAEGAELERTSALEDGSEASAGEEERPFAGLAALRERMSRDEG